MTRVLNYKVVIEEEKNRGKSVFVAYVPKLGLSDFGETIEKALANTKEAIECHLESLGKLNEDIPDPESSKSFFTEIPVTINSTIS